MRSVLYGGLRLGLYEPSKYLCELAFESTNILVKIASGAFSGAVATALTNPVEVLKVLSSEGFMVSPEQASFVMLVSRYGCK